MFSSTLARHVAAAAALIGLLFGAVAFAQGPAQIPIRIAWQPNPNAPLYLAREKGWFEEAGLKPQYVQFLAAPPMFAALQSESVDIADMGLAPAIIGKAQGIDIRIVAVALDVSATNALVVQKALNVGSARDLKGKRVGAQKGTTPYFGLIRYLERDGMGLQDIQYVDVNAPNAVPAFRKGEVDAIWVWSPWQNMLVGMGGKRVVSNKDIGALAPQVWAVRAEWARRNPEALQRFLRVIDRSFQQIGANRELAVKQLAATLNVEVPVADEILSANDHPALKAQGAAGYALSPVAGHPGASAGLSLAVKRAAEFLHSQGILKTMVNADDLVDPAPLKQFLGVK
jgi:aliphatic sulfonates family ABC transporter substrate-binding protein